MKKRLAVAFILGVLTLVNLPVLHAQPKKLYKGKIFIGYTVFPGYFPLIVAKEKGFFKEEGLDVETPQYVALADLSRDYVAGKMQGRANLTLDAAKESMEGLKQRIVLAIDYSNGIDAIMAGKEINSIQEFRGKRVAYEFSTLEEFFLKWALAESDMSLTDVIPVNADPEQSAKLLKEKKVDAAVTYEPFTSQHLSSPDFHAIYTSKEAPGLITDVLTFHADFVDSYPETIEAIIRAYFKGLSYSNKNPQEMHKILAEKYKDTPENIGKQLKGIKSLNEHDNEIAFTFAAGLKSLYGNMREIEKFISKDEKQESKLKTDRMIERKFIRKSMEKQKA